MAFVSEVLRKGRMGVYKFRIGTYTNSAGSIGGDIDTGLALVHSIKLVPKGVTIIDDESVVNVSLPSNGDVVSVVTTSDEEGYWFAIGK